jgi:hypothetical protein
VDASGPAPGPYPGEGEAPARRFCRDDPDGAFALGAPDTETDTALVPEAETDDTLGADTSSGGTLGVDTRVDGVLGVDTPTAGTLGVDTRTEGRPGVEAEVDRLEGVDGLEVDRERPGVMLDTPRPHACQGRASKATRAAAHTRATLDFLSAAIRNS